MSRYDATEPAPSTGRRELLITAARATAGCLISLGAWDGCAEGPESSRREANAGKGLLRVPLSRLPLEERVVLMRGEDPIEIQRTESGIVARSLLCTHFGCTVHWSNETQRYECPCHDGLFDAEGRVLMGPPSRPLDRLPVTVQDDVVLVGT